MLNRVISLAVAAGFLLFLQCPPAAMATRLPPETRKVVQELYPAGNVRLDGSVELPDHNFLLPLVPGPNPLKKLKPDELWKFPAMSVEPNLIIYENGWAHIKTERKGSSVTIRFPDDVPEATKKRLLTMKLPGDLIVPNGFVLPKSMKTLIGDLNIPLAEDVELMQPQFGHKKAASAQNYTGSGCFAFISIKDGTIILMDGKTFNKIAEFPTEGTPSSMTFSDGKIYIADQAKSRILLLDPLARKFLGQIDLPPNTAPRGIVALPNGRSLYVSFSGTSHVGVVDMETGKLLFNTKVPIGPSRMAVTSDGVYIAVLNVTAAELSIIASYNQTVIATVKLGSVPTGLVLHPTEKTAYVSNRMSNTISIIDLTKHVMLNSIKTGASPTGLAISANGDKLYAALGRDNTIAIYDTKTLQKLNEVKLPLDIDFPHQICLAPDGKHLLISSQQTDTIGVLDTETLEFSKQVQVGHSTQEIIWIPAG